MKKTVSIAIIIALVAVVLCFAACSGKDMEDNLTTAMDEISSAIDDATTLGEALDEDLSSALSGEDETTDDTSTTDPAENGKETTEEIF